jgi:hypothetical protein
VRRGIQKQTFPSSTFHHTNLASRQRSRQSRSWAIFLSTHAAIQILTPCLQAGERVRRRRKRKSKNSTDLGDLDAKRLKASSVCCGILQPTDRRSKGILDALHVFRLQERHAAAQKRKEKSAPSDKHGN